MATKLTEEQILDRLNTLNGERIRIQEAIADADTEWSASMFRRSLEKCDAERRRLGDLLDEMEYGGEESEYEDIWSEPINAAAIEEYEWRKSQGEFDD